MKKTKDDCIDNVTCIYQQHIEQFGIFPFWNICFRKYRNPPCTPNRSIGVKIINAAEDNVSRIPLTVIFTDKGTGRINL